VVRWWWCDGGNPEDVVNAELVASSKRRTMLMMPSCGDLLVYRSLWLLFLPSPKASWSRPLVLFGLTALALGLSFLGDDHDWMRHQQVPSRALVVAEPQLSVLVAVVEKRRFEVLEIALLLRRLLPPDLDDEARASVVRILFQLDEEDVEPFLLVENRTPEARKE
jgi:hypothetical protein